MKKLLLFLLFSAVCFGQFTEDPNRKLPANYSMGAPDPQLNVLSKYTADPSTTCANGQTYFNTATQLQRVCKGTAWASVYDPTTQTSTDGYFYVAPSACWFSVTGGTTTTTLTALGASFVPVINSTTSSAASVLTLQCYVAVPSKLTATKGVTISDVVIMYGAQTSDITSIDGAAISTIAFPAAGATETPSTVTPSAIAGSITQSSTTSNLAKTTAGAFYTSKLTLATPFNLATDLQALIVTLVFHNTATSVLTVNSPGLIVHYSNTLI